LGHQSWFVIVAVTTRVAIDASPENGHLDSVDIGFSREVMGDLQTHASDATQVDSGGCKKA
jgi:hypothetical protein